MIVRPATQDDCHVIAMLHADSWRSTYRHILAHDYLEHHVLEDRQDFWAARFAKYDKRKHYFCVAQAGRPEPASAITGFVCVLLDEEPEYGALLDNLHVAPDLHRRSIGRHLLSDAAHWIAGMHPDWSMHLWVYEANAKSVSFYRSVGGTEVDQRVIVTPAGNRATVLRLQWQDPLALARMLDASLGRSTA
ncbi:MAG: GNAT family N-acetyltransferase [Burkholderiaceae bacterium]